MKLGVIGGAGLLGSTSAFYSGTLGLWEEIKLYDIKETLQRSHAEDMDQALYSINGTKVRYADYSEMNDCDVILMTASLPERKVANRNEYMTDNLKLIQDAARNIKKYMDNKIVIMATAPIDVFNWVFYKEIGWSRQKFIGFATNDTTRMRWSVSHVHHVPYNDVDAICIGEHGEGQVNIFSGIKIKGEPANLREEEHGAIKEYVNEWFRRFQSYDAKRTTGWLSGLGLSLVMQKLVTESGQLVNESAILEGEYGETGLSIGVPVTVDRGGIKSIVDIPMSESEKTRFANTANKLRELQAVCGY